MAGLDALDQRIIAALQSDARRPNTEIARQLGVAEATVRKRIDRLVQDEIVSFVTFVDPLKVGFAIYASIGIQVELDKSRDVAEQLAQLPEVTFVGYATGTYDLIIAAILRSNDDFLAFLLEKVARIKGIRSTDTSLVLKLVKRSFVWGAPDNAMLEFLMPPATSS
ncbi:MAG TPA: Lrp/AsnC family transcriptional regulator [Dehalococcoidia bacterium]|nr:Lrp/AsnC family transcriptional regulator [Dehalococcoidia bacterium]